MGQVFCITNQKGGVGKTTTAVSLADAFAKSSAKTLLIDFDPQCNATSGLGLKPLPSTPFLPENAITVPLSHVIVSAQTPNLDILPGSQNTGDVEVLLRTTPAEAIRIHDQILKAVEQYEYVLFDCPPSLGHLTQIALFSATKVLIPIQCEFYAMEGFVQQMITVVKKTIEQKPEPPNFEEFVGVLLTMHDAALELSHLIENEVREFFGEITFNTVIPRDVTFSEASSHGKSIIDYAPRSRGTRAYVELCMEILNRRSV